mgnify:CR=1 FL=1|jgi:hypothetical protein
MFCTCFVTPRTLCRMKTLYWVVTIIIAITLTVVIHDKSLDLSENTRSLVIAVVVITMISWTLIYIISSLCIKPDDEHEYDEYVYGLCEGYPRWLVWIMSCIRNCHGKKPRSTVSIKNLTVPPPAVFVTVTE